MVSARKPRDVLEQYQRLRFVAIVPYAIGNAELSIWRKGMGLFDSLSNSMPVAALRHLGASVCMCGLALAPSVCLAERPSLPADYCHWSMRNAAIEAPLCALKGDADRGRAIVADTHRGNCLACHAMPIPDEPFHGTVGPPLNGVGGRYTAGQLRARVVDEQGINPVTIMPGYYRDPARLHRVAPALAGRTVLSAQEIEDVLAYLVTLK